MPLTSQEDDLVQRTTAFARKVVASNAACWEQANLNAVARQLNEWPRKTLGDQTPAEMFSQTVALTG